MTQFAQNIAFLRKKKGLSQQTLSEELNIPRSTLSGYEQSYAEPDITTIIQFAQFFDVYLDDLLIEKLSALKKADRGKYKPNSNLGHSASLNSKSDIQLVDTKAEAGYMESFDDPEYIGDLPTLQIPQIPRGTYRAFEIRGDSMLPIEPGSVVIASYVERLEDIKAGQTYVVASKEGLVYKRLYPSAVKNKLRLVSDNALYPSYELPWEEVKEIWKFYAYISFSDGKASFDAMVEEKQERLFQQMDDVHKEICPHKSK